MTAQEILSKRQNLQRELREEMENYLTFGILNPRIEAINKEIIFLQQNCTHEADENSCCKFCGKKVGE